MDQNYELGLLQKKLTEEQHTFEAYSENVTVLTRKISDQKHKQEQNKDALLHEQERILENEMKKAEAEYTRIKIEFEKAKTTFEKAKNRRDRKIIDFINEPSVSRLEKEITSIDFDIKDKETKLIQQKSNLSIATSRIRDLTQKIERLVHEEKQSK